MATHAINDLAAHAFELVNKELASTLDAARAELEGYVDGRAGPDALLRTAEHLHAARGALKIVEIHGAALLAEEMEQTCRRLAEAKDEQKSEQGVEALTRAMVQLPAYLERLLGGGKDVALAIARHLVVFLHRPGNQAQFSAQLAAQTARREPLRDVQQWITEHPDGDLSVDALAARARLSPRHFARAFQAETGVTPGRYVERVRVEHARRLLEEGSPGIAQVARACGYGTPEALRRAFVKTLGQPPTEYRRRFGAPRAP